MVKFRCSTIVVLLLCLCHVYGHKPANLAEDAQIRVVAHHDSLNIRLITSDPSFQLSALMQGLHFNLHDSALCQVVEIVLPNAKMVRNKIKHHPNEVKAMHKQAGEEVRPDLLPLISALNDTCCIATSCEGHPISCSHIISLNKTNGEMTFSLCILPPNNISLQDSVMVEVQSSPIEMRPEFEGRRLSQENRMPPGGMGQPPIGNNDQNRIAHFTKMVQIENSNK